MKYIVAILLLLFAVSLADAGEITPVQKSVVQKTTVEHTPVQKSAVQKSHHCKCCICVLRAELMVLRQRPLCNLGKICAIKKTIRVLTRHHHYHCH